VLQIELCQESVEWATEEKRNFLRYRIETRLAELYLQIKVHAPCFMYIPHYAHRGPHYIHKAPHCTRRRLFLWFCEPSREASESRLRFVYWL
jgi:proteasome regulatory subunit RPN6-like protein